MERVNNLNVERLAWALEDRGTSAAECAREAGVSLAALEAALAGEKPLTFGQLGRVAKVLGRGVLFFLASGSVSTEKMHTPQFRTLAGQQPYMSTRLRLLIERVEAQREVYRTLVEGIGGDEFPSFRMPVLSGPTIETKAASARQWLGLGSRCSFISLRRAIEAKGMLVFRSNGYAGPWQIPSDSSVLGFSLFDESLPVIFVRKRRWETQQLFTLAHELAHILIDRRSVVDEEEDFFATTGVEARANKFAGNLLVPQAHLAAIQVAEMPQEVSQLEEWLKPHTALWGVSTEVVLRRLLDVGRIGQETYQLYRAWCARREIESSDEGGSRAYRYREPKHLFGDTFVSAVFGALERKKITVNRASRYLDNLKVAHLRELERFSAGI